MTNKCTACKKPLRSSNIACCKCDNAYHFSCVNLTKVSEETKTNWLCSSCGTNEEMNDTFTTPTRGMSPKTSKGHTPTSFMAANPSQLTPETFNNLTTEIKLMREDVSELKEHIRILTEHITQCHTRLDDYANRIEALEKCQSENSTLKSTIIDLREQLDNQAQAALANEVEIVGVNEAPNENQLHLTRIICHKLGVNIEDHDIDHVRRVGSKRPPTIDDPGYAPRPLTVRFVRRVKRDEFLCAAKVRRNITSADIDVPGINRNIYFNERLTKTKRQLFRAAKLSAKEHGYKFCWLKNGLIFIRKREGNPSTVIKNVQDLDKFTGTSSLA